MFVAGISKIAKVSASVYTSPVYVYRFCYRNKNLHIELPSLKYDVAELSKNQLLFSYFIILF